MAKAKGKGAINQHKRMAMGDKVDGGSKPSKKKYAKGGSVSARADGIAKKGKTKGKMC